MYPNWETVEYASTRLMSFCTRPIEAANIAVVAPMKVTKVCAVGASSNNGDRRATMYTPAVTMVAAWMSAETGVGPSIASGNHVWSESWADLPHAPMNRSSAMPVAVAGASVSAPLNTAPYSSVPSTVQSHMTPRPKPKSPTRFTMNAFFPAWVAAGRVYQNPISRYEQSPTASQKTYRSRKSPAMTSIVIENTNRFRYAK